MSILTVTTTHDYRADTLVGIDSVIFSAPDFSAAIFNASQFGPGKISNSLTVTGDSHNNEFDVSVSGGTFSAAAWTFSNWTPGYDMINFLGSSNAETITGSNYNDYFFPEGGADSIHAGAGDDGFEYQVPTDTAAGATIDGGTGYDKIRTDGDSKSYDLSVMTIGGVEALEFQGTGITDKVGANQIGAGKIAHIIGNLSATQALVVNSANVVDLSGVTFEGWGGAHQSITINGTTGVDSLTGSSQNDLLDGKAGADTMRGGAGNDNYTVDNAGDIADESIAGSSGVDAIYSSAISINLADTVHFKGTIENAVLQSAANLNLTGNGLANTLVGNAGNNTIDGGGGTDYMRGGAGNDHYVVDNAGDIVDESVAGSSGGDVAYSSTVSINLADAVHFRGVIEGAVLTGSANLNVFGGALANFIKGNSGANVLDGRLGADTMVGGAGNDVFRFDTNLGAGNVDHITDYTVANDQLQIDNAVFTGLASGALGASAFFTGAAAHDADDHIIYNSATGALFFDVDGTGATAQIQFATLSAGLALTAGEFTVI